MFSSVVYLTSNAGPFEHPMCYIPSPNATFRTHSKLSRTNNHWPTTAHAHPKHQQQPCRLNSIPLPPREGIFPPPARSTRQVPSTKHHNTLTILETAERNPYKFQVVPVPQTEGCSSKEAKPVLSRVAPSAIGVPPTPSPRNAAVMQLPPVSFRALTAIH